MFGFYDFLAVTALILAIGINCITVYLQRTRQIYRRFGGNALLVHSIIISLAWGWFVVTEFLLARSSWRTDAYPLAGAILLLLGLTLFAAAVRQIGTGALGNSNFFGGEVKQLHGIYRVIKEPIYTSYVIWFIGLGLLTGQISFYLIAGVAAVGLFAIESKIEDV